MSERTETITAELLALRDSNGVVNPVTVVDWAAKHKKSAIYSALTWDDAEAAHRYRVWQVRALISVHIVDKQGDRKFVSLSVDRPVGGYRQISDVLNSVDLREVMLSDALDELKRVQKRFDRLTELANVWAEADKVSARRKPQKMAA